MAVRLLLIVGLGSTAYWCADVYSESIWRSVLCPVVGGLSLTALTGWVASLFRGLGTKTRHGSGYSGDGGFDMFDSGGGDGA